MNAHTPGPWFVGADGKVWRRDPRDLYENGGGVAGDHPVATAHRGWPRWEDGFPVEANARLIAAAPELLVVAHDFHEVLKELGLLCECGQPDCRTTRLRSAIAKAGGAS